MNENYELIIVIICRGYSDVVMDAARRAGATGGTVINARGLGSKTAEKFFGITIQPEKELVYILAPESIRGDIMREVCKDAGLNTAGKGIAFSLKVDDVLGIVKHSEAIKQEEQKNQN